MNSKHPYEKHLAEKLVQLPPPGDPDQNWQQMKTLLDKSMPRGGGKGPGGSFRWWIAGTVVVAVVVGTWFGGKQLLTKDQRNEAVAGTIKTVNNKTAPSVALEDKNSSQQAVPQTNAGNESAQSGKHDPRGAAYASVTETQGANASGSGSNEQTANSNAGNTTVPATEPANNQLTAKHDKAGGHSLTAGNSRSSGNTENSARLLADNNNTSVPSNNSNNNKTTNHRNNIYSQPSNSNSRENNSDNVKSDNAKSGNSNNIKSSNVNNIRSRSGHSNSGNRNNTASGNRNHANAERGSNLPAVKSKREKVNRPGKQASDVINAENEDIKNRYTYTPVISQPSQPSGSGLQESPVTVKVNYTGTTVISPSGIIQREFTYYTQSDLFPNMVQRDKNTARKSSRVSDDEDKTFAFGLSLPLAFPLGDQEALGFNSRGGVNTISDYIPSPHFQYHFNNKTYIQAGLQFSSPQFIRPILLYEHERMSAPNVMEYNSIYARKLYYFNLPISIHHSPLRNFYMGAGLQFSSMMSGIAQVQQIKRFYTPIGPDEYIMSNYYTKFKNDSLSHRFNTNELRLLLDINYYWNRFTVGLQYNQAFNNYVSFQVNPGSPYIFDKNKSLQFYLRYNIWEDKKRNKLSKNQSVLTLK